MDTIMSQFDPHPMLIYCPPQKTLYYIVLIFLGFPNGHFPRSLGNKTLHVCVVSLCPQHACSSLFNPNHMICINHECVGVVW
jgi:hypothetical protein